MVYVVYCVECTVYTVYSIRCTVYGVPCIPYGFKPNKFSELGGLLGEQMQTIPKYKRVFEAEIKIKVVLKSVKKHICELIPITRVGTFPLPHPQMFFRFPFIFSATSMFWTCANPRTVHLALLTSYCLKQKICE
jgi:hypothetical protein